MWLIMWSRYVPCLCAVLGGVLIVVCYCRSMNGRGMCGNSMTQSVGKGRGGEFSRCFVGWEFVMDIFSFFF